MAFQGGSLRFPWIMKCQVLNFLLLLRTSCFARRGFFRSASASPWHFFCKNAWRRFLWDFNGLFYLKFFLSKTSGTPKRSPQNGHVQSRHVINPVAETIKQNDLEVIDENRMTFGFSKEPLFLFLPELWYATNTRSPRRVLSLSEAGVVAT